jgi:hypothetical protein
MPSESIAKETGGRSRGKLTMIPLQPIDAPPDAAEKAQNRFYGLIKQQSESEGALVRDVAGMSGGPVYGTKLVDQTLKAWLIGVQVAWYRERKIVSFCPLPEFLLALKEASEEFRRRFPDLTHS